MSRRVLIWLHGLLGAVIGGAANALTAILVKPQDFNLGDGLWNLQQMAAGGALIGAALYLAKHPVWKLDSDGTDPRA